METKTGKFKIGEVNGVQVNRECEFEYREFASLEEARTSTDWTDKNLLDLINSNEKATAKANKYQKETAEFRPDTSSPEFKREQIIKNLVNTFGLPRDIAEQQVDAMIAAGKKDEQAS